MSKGMQRTDWEQMYMNKWHPEPQHFSEKWRWHYSQQPYVRVPPEYSMPECNPYKRGGPQTSQMFKHLRPNGWHVDSYVNTLGEL